jgi:hypothetical protein
VTEKFHFQEPVASRVDVIHGAKKHLQQRKQFVSQAIAWIPHFPANLPVHLIEAGRHIDENDPAVFGGSPAL